MSTPRVVVVGAGISGLAAAHSIAEELPDAALTILEAGASPGGKVATIRDEGYVVEGGPNGFLDNAPATLALARRVGLGERLLPSAKSAAKRFVFLREELRRLPEGPLALARSDVLSWPGKLRLVLEPVLPRGGGGEESVYEFAKRRLGDEVARSLVAPMVGGIYAGDAKALSVQAAFPRLAALEREHGSLVRGAIALMRRRRAERRSGEGGEASPAIQTGPGGWLTSFRDGLAEMPARLAERLARFVRTGSPARAIRRDGGRWAVELETGDTVGAEVVVLAVPADAAARLVGSADEGLTAALAAIPLAPVAVVALGFERAGLGHDLDGFGFLVAPGEPVRVLGVLWDSSIYAGRAPEGRVLLRAIVGGARDPSALELDDDGIERVVREDLRVTMGVRASPVYRRVVRWPRGIPQYVLGHTGRVAAADRAAASLGGLVLAGNSFRGVAFNACIEHAPAVARAVAASLGHA